MTPRPGFGFFGQAVNKSQFFISMTLKPEKDSRMVLRTSYQFLNFKNNLSSYLRVSKL